MECNNGAAIATSTEEWKTVKDYPDYAVSNFGRVKRVKDSPRNHKKTGTLLSLKPHPLGYVWVALARNKRKKRFAVHRLVLEAFVRPALKNEQCNHLDGTKTHNHLNNLEWVTPTQNINHAYSLGLLKGRKGSRTNLAKLQEGEVYLIKTLLARGIHKNIISSMFQTHLRTIHRIDAGEIWGHVQLPPHLERKTQERKLNRHKLSIGKARIIRKLKANQGLSYAKIGKLFGVSASSVYDVVAQKIYKEN